MVQLDVVRAANSALVRAQPLVAVFVGGTSGIGQATIHALAATQSKHGKGLRLYIVGRNAEAAEKTISECSRVCPGGRFRFVKAEDLALLKDVDRVCAEIIRVEEEENANDGAARVDLLVMTQALLNFKPRTASIRKQIQSNNKLGEKWTETKEGLDIDMSLLYYSRMRFIIQLLPLLLASPLPAHVISVYAAGMEGKLFPEDLSLRDPQHYGFANCRSHVVHMKTLFMETLAERYRGRLSLVHVYPSLVITEAFDKVPVPAWVKLIWRWLLAPILRPFSVPPRESGERVLFLATPRFPARQAINPDMVAKLAENTATEEGAGIAMGSDGSSGSGAYSVNWDGETFPTKKLSNTYKNAREEGLAGKVWDHTMKAFEVIESGNAFSG